MFHTEDEEVYHILTVHHNLTLDSVDIERKLCQTRLLHLYNGGKITCEEFAVRLSKLSSLTKSLYSMISELYNLTDDGRG